MMWRQKLLLLMVVENLTDWNGLVANNEKKLFLSYNLYKLNAEGEFWSGSVLFITTVKEYIIIVLLLQLQGTQCMHRQHKNMDDWKSAQTEWRQNRSFLLFPFLSSLKVMKPSTICLPDSITLGSHNIPLSDSARNLGFILDSKLSMKKHIIKICQTAYFKL